MPEPFRDDVTPSEQVTAIVYPAAARGDAGSSLILAHGRLRRSSQRSRRRSSTTARSSGGGTASNDTSSDRTPLTHVAEGHRLDQACCRGSSARSGL
jgi:hypothetical protein